MRAIFLTHWMPPTLTTSRLRSSATLKMWPQLKWLFQHGFISVTSLFIRHKQVCTAFRSVFYSCICCLRVSRLFILASRCKYLYILCWQYATFRFRLLHNEEVLTDSKLKSFVRLFETPVTTLLFFCTPRNRKSCRCTRWHSQFTLILFLNIEMSYAAWNLTCAFHTRFYSVLLILTRRYTFHPVCEDGNRYELCKMRPHRILLLIELQFVEFHFICSCMRHKRCLMSKKIPFVFSRPCPFGVCTRHQLRKCFHALRRRFYFLKFLYFYTATMWTVKPLFIFSFTKKMFSSPYIEKGDEVISAGNPFTQIRISAILVIFFSSIFSYQDVEIIKQISEYP